jgi:hypothetical protein
MFVRHPRPGTYAAVTAETTDVRQTSPQAEPRPRRGRSWRFWIRRIAEIVLVGLAVVFVLRRAHNLASVGHIFLHVRWPWLIAGAAAETASILALAFLQQRLLLSTAARVTFRSLVPITLASNAVALSIPAGVLVAEGYMFRQYRRIGASRVEAAWVELAGGAIAAAALATVALAGALVVGGGLRSVLVPPLAVVFAGAALTAVLFQRTALLSRLSRAALGFGERHAPEGVRSRLQRSERLASEMAELKPTASQWGIGAGAAVVNWLLDAMVLASAILAIGASVPWRSLLIVYAGGQLLAELPITPGGLGIVEGGLVALLTRFHLPAASATAAVLAYRGLSFWLLLVVGWMAAAQIRLGGRSEDPPGG